MPRNKKRIQIKKKSVKKVVAKRNQKTPEQKAKDNDMLKLLLGRQVVSQTPTQQNQHTDEYRQKLEDYNKQLVEARREKDSLAAQVKQAKEEPQKEEPKQEQSYEDTYQSTQNEYQNNYFNRMRRPQKGYRNAMAQMILR